MIRRVVNFAESQGYARFQITRFHFLYVYKLVVRYTGRVNKQRAKLDGRHKNNYDSETVVSTHGTTQGKTRRVLKELVMSS